MVRETGRIDVDRVMHRSTPGLQLYEEPSGNGNINTIKPRGEAVFNLDMGVGSVGDFHTRTKKIAPRGPPGGVGRTFRHLARVHAALTITGGKEIPIPSENSAKSIWGPKARTNNRGNDPNDSPQVSRGDGTIMYVENMHLEGTLSNDAVNNTTRKQIMHLEGGTGMEKRRVKYGDHSAQSMRGRE
jgi:hypothetical protein